MAFESMQQKSIALKTPASNINLLNGAVPATGPVSQVVKGYEELTSTTKTVALDIAATDSDLRPGDREIQTILFSYTSVR
jgi:hypothetical protein